MWIGSIRKLKYITDNFDKIFKELSVCVDKIKNTIHKTEENLMMLTNKINSITHSRFNETSEKIEETLTESGFEKKE